MSPTFRLAASSARCWVLMALAAGSAQAQDSREPVTLNFSNADIEAVARTMAAITGRAIVVDPRVKGTMSLATEQPVKPSVAFDQFLATLRLSGYAVVESAGLLKLVPEADAKLQGGGVSVGALAPGGNQVVTQIIPLSHESAANLVPILRPLIGPNNTINVNSGSNALVITDYADNVRRLRRIVAALDVSNATDVEVMPLRHALASDLVTIVQRLVESSASGGSTPAAQGQADTSYRTTVIAEPRSNTLIVRAANAARLNLVRTIVQQLDQPISQNPSGNIYVVHLKNADATRLAITLRAALSGMAASDSGGTASTATSSSTQGITNTSAAVAAGGRSTATLRAGTQPSTGGQVQADPATNSLIITAPEPQYRQLRAVIDRLDGRRAQIFVESLIVEVNEDKSADFGIQWQGLGQIGNLVSYLGTNFGTGSNNIVTLNATSDASSVSVGKGANFALAYRTGGVYVLGFLARALQESGDGNVLSTPNLLTLDNEEGSMVVGQNVPFVTGQYTSTSGSGTGSSANPFQTIERKDVGLTLKVKPQIGENGAVRMQIYQEVSSVQASTANATNGPTTNKRAIESTVLVQDGGIVVLGGLMQDEYTGNQEKIPVAGDLPVVGNLFRSSTRSRKKTNLMVFIRPVVLRDAVDAETLSLDRYGEMRTRQLGAQPAQSKLVPVDGGPVLPGRPPK